MQELSTEVLENISKGVFDFEDNTDGTAFYIAGTISSANKKIKGEDSGLKIKRLEAKQTEEETTSNVPHKRQLN